MTITLASITFDCDDALAVATFWGAVLDQPLDPDGSIGFASIGRSGDGSATPIWMFSKVPEGKVAKNRMHVDLATDDREREVDRLVGLGAERIADVDEWGHRWTVLQDPEGNEFCLAEEPTAA